MDPVAPFTRQNEKRLETMARTPLFLAGGLVLAFSAFAFTETIRSRPSIQAKSYSSTQTSVELLFQFQADQIRLPLEWFSVERWERVPPYQDAQGSPIFTNKLLSDDLLIADPAELQSLMSQWQPLPPGQMVPLPGDDRLLLRIDETTGESAFLCASRVAGVPPESATGMLSYSKIPYPDGQQGPLNQPLETRWTVTPYSLGIEQNPEQITHPRVGSGFGGVIAEQDGYFAYSGELDQGPDNQSGVLHCARDSAGFLWYWFQP